MRGETDWLPPSEYMVSCLSAAVGALEGGPSQPSRAHAHQAFSALHSLISGTLDVDRMDYLLRDSRFAGTVIGNYDLDLIVNSLSLQYSEDDDRVYLCVADRARGAIDDFLWSRWQIYIQVLNHKANVMLNALFARAFRAAVPNPDLFHFENILQFTDDSVMTAVRDKFLLKNLGHHASLSSAKLAFLRSSLPRHLRVIDLSASETSEERAYIDRARAELAKQTGLLLDDIECHVTESDLMKPGSELPRVLRKELSPTGAMTRRILKTDFIAESWAKLNRPARIRRAHFFTQRKQQSSDGNSAPPTLTPPVANDARQHPSLAAARSRKANDKRGK
jgi:HD superfamily phosphohydrolase